MMCLTLESLSPKKTKGQREGWQCVLGYTSRVEEYPLWEQEPRLATGALPEPEPEALAWLWVGPASFPAL